MSLVLLEQVKEEFVRFLHDLSDPRVGAVDFVDHHDDRQLLGQSLAQHEPGLGQRALRGVDEQQHAVDHFQAALHFTTEVGMARGVDDVDGDIAAVRGVMLHGGVLGEDRDALLALEGQRVKNPLLDLLSDPEGTRLPQHCVNQGGLPMVDVSDDRDVAQDRHGWALTEELSVGAGKLGESNCDIQDA